MVLWKYTAHGTSFKQSDKSNLTMWHVTDGLVDRTWHL